MHLRMGAEPSLGEPAMFTLDGSQHAPSSIISAYAPITEAPAAGGNPTAGGVQGADLQLDGPVGALQVELSPEIDLTADLGEVHIHAEVAPVDVMLEVLIRGARAEDGDPAIPMAGARGGLAIVRVWRRRAHPDRRYDLGLDRWGPSVDGLVREGRRVDECN